MLRSLAVLAAMSQTGCGSYWDLRPGEELARGCSGLLDYFPDADGDQWGEPGSTGTALCGPDEALGLTASNDLDCDEGDPEITGQAGAICPDALAGASPCVFGRLLGESEFVGNCDTSPLVAFGQASQECLAWSGWETPESIAAGGAGHRGLAALETEFEYQELRGFLEARSPGQPVALWLDLRWSGSVSEDSWVWPDGGAATFIPPCGGVEAVPGDFWPDLAPGQAESDAAIEANLDDVRSALVYDGAAWCRGVPSAAGTPYAERSAHLLCERPRPDLADYATAPSGDAPEPD